MKRGLISIACVIAVALMSSAQVVHHEVKVGNFTRLNLLDDINVDYRCNADSAGLAVLDCTQDVANHLMFSINDKGRLSIQVDDLYERQGNLPTIILYSSTLDEVENSGDSTLRVSGLPPLKAFKVRLTDNGKVVEVRRRHNDGEEEKLTGKLDETYSLPMEFDEFKKAITKGKLKLK